MTTATPIDSLRDEQQTMRELLELMQQEQQHLMAVDVEQLNQVTVRKGELVSRMAALALARHQALAAAGHSAGEEGMAPWLAECGQTAAAPLWQELLGMTRKAKELNRVNGMLINKHMAHTQGALAALRPAATENASVYGPSGKHVAARQSGRFVVG